MTKIVTPAGTRRDGYLVSFYFTRCSTKEQAELHLCTCVRVRVTITLQPRTVEIKVKITLKMVPTELFLQENRTGT